MGEWLMQKTGAQDLLNLLTVLVLVLLPALHHHRAAVDAAPAGVVHHDDRGLRHVRSGAHVARDREGDVRQRRRRRRQLPQRRGCAYRPRRHRRRRGGNRALRSYGRGFDSSLNYGTARFFAFFARGLLYVMRWLHHFVGNWGVAIILLTILVKLVLFPLTYKQMQSMNEMRKLQPEIEKLKAKHGDDREKMNAAVMQLYQQHKVNPLGGCLPMLLQMPIWFALYAALQTSVELYRQPFFGWIHDLTQRDPWFVLPVAMGVSSFVMQKLSPQPTENSQAKVMLYFFPIFFTFIMLNVPAGLTLYIFVNNVLSIAQQQVMMKQQAVVAPAKG